MKTCILVDDDIDDREVFELALSQARSGTRVFSFKNGIEALRKISDVRFTPDYIFLDINMPEMSGHECLLAIKNIAHLESVPVYMYTTSTYDRDKFLAHGASKVIAKPTRMSELITILKELVV